MFVPAYWVWVGTAMLTNQLDAARPGLRLVVFAVGLALIFMAIALPDAYGPLGLMLAVAYWLARLGLGARPVVGHGSTPTP